MRGLLGQIKLWPAWAKVVAVVAAVVVVAGGAGVAMAPRMGLGRTARSAARPSVSPSAQVSAVPTSSPSSSPVPLVSTLACKLPVSNGQLGSGGFVTFPQAAFTADPASAVKTDNSYGLSFDRAFGRWVPVPRSWVSPDGTRYAYWEWQTRSIQAVAVATGAETALGPKPNGPASAARLNPGAGWLVIEALDSGVYAVPNGGYQSSSAGLFLFPWSGIGELQVTGSGFWHAIGGGAAWGTVSQSVPEGAANTILRLDLGGGSPAEWFSRPSLQSRVVGFDLTGHPVVEASSKNVMEAWLVTGQSNGTKLLSLTPTPGQQNPAGPGRPVLQSVVGDDRGIWLATSDGLYFSASGRTEKVSTVTGQLGGGCA